MSRHRPFLRICRAPPSSGIESGFTFFSSHARILYGPAVGNVEQALIAEALAAFGCTEVHPLKPGAQKDVRLVERNGDRLVLKVISVRSAHAEALRRAEREVHLLSELDSPHVVRVVDHLIELGDPIQGAAWLEEALDGEDLSGLLTGSPWDPSDAVKLGQDVANGLAAAHAKSVVHRDLSPNNIRRLSTGAFKVLDFGFARFTLRSGLTIAGQPGTPQYMSPEHIHAYSGGPTAASDIFMLGILLYEALSGANPIPYHGDDFEYVKRLSAAAHEEISTVRTDLSTDLAAFVNRCLHPQPARRYRNGEAAAIALGGLK